MFVRVTPEGEAQLERRKTWWREHRPKNPGLFDREFAEVIAQIGERPESFPVFAVRRSRTIRRCLMPKTRCHLYLEIDANVGEVRILAAAGGQRRRPPRIKPR